MFISAWFAGAFTTSGQSDFITVGNKEYGASGSHTYGWRCQGSGSLSATTYSHGTQFNPGGTCVGVSWDLSVPNGEYSIQVEPLTLLDPVPNPDPNPSRGSVVSLVLN